MLDYTPALSEEQLFDAARLMCEQGGGFASCIANAYFRADIRNRRRLLYAFGDLFVEFDAYVEDMKKEKAND